MKPMRAWVSALAKGVAAGWKNPMRGVSQPAGSGRGRRRLSPTGANVDFEALVGEFDAQKQQLLSFSAGVEREFLELGNGLYGMLAKAKALRIECQAISQLLAGRKEESAIQFSFHLLKKAEDLVQASYNQYTHVFAVFEALSGGLHKIALLQVHLRQTLRALPVVTIQFRIQAGACDAATRETFLNLAGEMNALLGEVHQNVDRQFQDLLQIQNTSDRLVQDLSSTISRHRQDVSKTMQRCREQLSLLGQALRNCGDVVQGVSGQSVAIEGGVNCIVKALQCQDITSQKIQHVGQAIDEITRHLKEAKAGPRSAPAGDEIWQFLAHANAIQLGQLKGVFSELEQAAADIVQGIGTVENHAGQLMEHAVKTGQSAIESSVVEYSVRGMQDILAIVSSTVSNIRTVCAALEPLRSKFTYYTEHISGLALRVRLAALNAQIYALGVEHGQALGVLAEQTRMISDLILSDVSALATQLAELAASVENLHQRLDDFYQLSGAENRLLAQETDLAEQKLVRVKTELPQRIQSIPPLHRQLAEMTRQTAAIVSFPTRLAEVKAATTEFLMRHAGRETAELCSARFAPSLERLRLNYTMNDERVVHDQAAGAAAPSLPDARAAAAEPAVLVATEEFGSGPAPGTAGLPPVAPPAPMPEANPQIKDGLGANVELF